MNQDSSSGMSWPKGHGTYILRFYSQISTNILKQKCFHFYTNTGQHLLGFHLTNRNSSFHISQLNLSIRVMVQVV